MSSSSVGRESPVRRNVGSATRIMERQTSDEGMSIQKWTVGTEIYRFDHDFGT